MRAKENYLPVGLLTPSPPAHLVSLHFKPLAFSLVFCGYTCSSSMYAGVRGQLVGVKSLLPPCEFQGPSSAHQPRGVGGGAASTCTHGAISWSSGQVTRPLNTPWLGFRWLPEYRTKDEERSRLRKRAWICSKIQEFSMAIHQLGLTSDPVSTSIWHEDFIKYH